MVLLVGAGIGIAFLPPAPQRLALRALDLIAGAAFAVIALNNARNAISRLRDRQWIMAALSAINAVVLVLLVLLLLAWTFPGH
jgi:zinc transporter ZupT